jgi:hypothetical protein
MRWFYREIFRVLYVCVYACYILISIRGVSRFIMT